MTWEYQGLNNCWQNNWIFCWRGTGKVWHFSRPILLPDILPKRSGEWRG